MRATVVIPTVPSRQRMLEQAVASAAAQTEPCKIVVALDSQFTGRYRQGGAARTRNQGLERVDTEWVAFLDDDDALYPEHVAKCLALADETGADLVYPWFDGQTSRGVLYGQWNGKLEEPEGREFGPEQKAYLREIGNFIPVTVVAKTEAIRHAGAFPLDVDCEDWHCWNRMLDNGAKFVHLPERTWRYNVHGKHLSWAWA